MGWKRREVGKKRRFSLSGYSAIRLHISKSLRWIITLGLMAVMAGSALAFGAVEPWSIATFSLSIIALLVLWVIKSLSDRRLEISAPLTALPLLALTLLGVLQAITITDSYGKRFAISLDTEATRLATEVILILLIAFLLSANFLAKVPTLNWLRTFLIFFGLALSVFALIQRFTWNGEYYWIIERRSPSSSPFGPFVSHNHFAGYIEMIAPIPVALILRRAVRGGLALIYGFAAAIMGVAVVASLSRGGMISLTAGLMFVVAFGFKPSRPWEMEMGSMDDGVRRRDKESPQFAHYSPIIRVYRSPSRFTNIASRVGAVIVMVVVIGVGIWWVGADPVIQRLEYSKLTQSGLDANHQGETFYQSRGLIWRDTAAMIRDKWATGIGLGAYSTAYPIYDSRNGSLLVEQSHNDYLQIMADGGIFGAIIALSFILLVARDIARASRHSSRAMSATALGAGSGMFALFVHSLFDFNFQIPSNALLFLVLTSVVSQIASEATKNRTIPIRR